MVMMKILVLLLAITAYAVQGIDQTSEKDHLYTSEPANRFGKKMEILDNFSDFRYDSMQRKPQLTKTPTRSQNRRGDVFYVVPTNQPPKPRQPKQRSHNDFMAEIMKDYQALPMGNDMPFPPKSKKPEFDYFPGKFAAEDVKYPELEKFEQDEPKYGGKFEPEEYKFGGKFLQEEPKYISRFEPEEKKYGGKFEPEEVKFGGKFLQEEPKYISRFEPEEHKFGGKFEPEEHKFGGKFEPEEHKFGGKFLQEEPKYVSRFEPEEHKFGGKFEPEEHKFGGKFLQEEPKYMTRFEPEEHKYLSKFEPEEQKFGGKFEPEPEDHKFGGKFEPEPQKFISKFEPMKNVYEDGPEDGKLKDDIGRYEHYEPYVPKRRQPVRPTFQRSFSNRDDARPRHQERPQDFGYYTQESAETQTKPKRRQPPPCLNEDEFESCDCE